MIGMLRKKKEKVVLENETKEKNKKKRKWFRISKLTILVILLDILAIDALIVINNDQFKSFWIPTAMTTMRTTMSLRM